MEVMLKKHEIPPHLADYFRPKRMAAGNNMLIPHRVAIALQEAGWIIRQDNVWAKKSPMPESINGSRWVRCRVKVAGTGWNGDHPSQRGTAETQGRVGGGNNWYGVNGGAKPGPNRADWQPCPGCPKCSATNGWVLRRGSHRCTTAHEYIFQIVKSGEYFSDGDAAQEAVSGGTHSRGKKLRPPKETGQAAGGDGHGDWCVTTPDPVESRNPRSVWSLSSEAYKGAHFAVFPSELVRRCLVGSLSKGGCCPACGNQYAPQMVKERVPTRPGEATKVPGKNSRMFQERDPDHPGEYKGDRYDLEVGNRDPQRHVARTRVLGYLPTCTCQAGPAVPPIVLEPFCGSGTTLQVATHMGFRGIGFERNPKYIKLAEERIVKTPRCLQPKAARKVKARPIQAGQLHLFPEPVKSTT